MDVDARILLSFTNIFLHLFGYWPYHNFHNAITLTCCLCTPLLNHVGLHAKVVFHFLTCLVSFLYQLIRLCSLLYLLHLYIASKISSLLLFSPPLDPPLRPSSLVLIATRHACASQNNLWMARQWVRYLSTKLWHQSSCLPRHQARQLSKTTFIASSSTFKYFTQPKSTPHLISFISIDAACAPSNLIATMLSIK